MLKSNRVVTMSQAMCSECDYAETEVDDNLGYTLTAGHSTPKSTLTWISELNLETHQECPNCLSAMIRPVFYDQPPELLVFEYPEYNIKTNHKLRYVIDGKSTVLYLRGIVYHGAFHFTSRIISSEGDIWFNDGRTTGKTSEEDGHLSHTSDSRLRTCRERDLVLAIYAQM
jgi:hypothetical protein